MNDTHLWKHYLPCYATRSINIIQSPCSNWSLHYFIPNSISHLKYVRFGFQFFCYLHRGIPGKEVPCSGNIINAHKQFPQPAKISQNQFSSALNERLSPNLQWLCCLKIPPVMDSAFMADLNFKSPSWWPSLVKIISGGAESATIRQEELIWTPCLLLRGFSGIQGAEAHVLLPP